MAHITFIHGIANKPAADRLLEIWLRSLAQDDGINLATRGITSSMVYWADVMYANPAEDEGAYESVDAEVSVRDEDENLGWSAKLAGDEKAFVASLAGKLNFAAASPQDDNFAPPKTDEPGFERIPLPWFLKRRLMKILLKDVHHYLFNADFSPRPEETYKVQDELRQRFISTLRRDAEANAGNGPHIVISHSMGTVIAYDCLKNAPECPEIDQFMTIGSPLGLDEVQDNLKPGWSREDGFPSLKVKGSWVNVFDRLDPVALDARLANDYRRNGEAVVIDQQQTNAGQWRHSIEKYLIKPELRSQLAKQLGIDWS